ncbi:MAG: hypothetical protein QXF17_01430 [Ignisphaera sp.]
MVCNDNIETNKFLLVPLCHNAKIKIICHTCAVKLLGNYLAEHVDEEFKVKIDPVSLSSDTKAKDVFSVIDEVFVELIDRYKLTWFEILTVSAMLYNKVMTYYIKDAIKYWTNYQQQLQQYEDNKNKNNKNPDIYK